ncbi:MAG: M48 family metalloprotease [Thermoleophilaceae bacterium]
MALPLGLTLAILLPALIVAPHLAGLHRAAPTTAASVWVLALAARALVSIGTALFVFVELPQTAAFRTIAAWCWHQVLPIVGQHLGVSGHPLGHAAVVLPGLALALSLLWLLFGLTRAWLALRRLLARGIRRGPLGSTVVPDERVLVAVPALGRGQILVSDGALDAMDDEELRASLAHERAHVSRRHRPLLLLAALLCALARPVPGTRAAERQLVFNLERDADECAVRCTRDPLALASAICKAATTGGASPAVASLGGRGSTTLRVKLLLAGDECGPEVAAERSARTLVAVLAVLVTALSLAVPAVMLGAPDAGAVVVQGSELCYAL